MPVTVTLTEKQVEALLELAGYGEDHVEAELDNAYTLAGQRQHYRATLSHGIAARRAIHDAQRLLNPDNNKENPL